MYRISEFSKITNLTVKALRYYDDEGLLHPSSRDENNYRQYTDEDFKKARLIALLRKLGFSIAEIKEVTQNCKDKQDLSCYLSEKKTMIASHIRSEKKLINRINLYLTPETGKEYGMDYQISVKEIVPVSVVSVRFKGKYSDVGNYIGQLYRTAKGNATGAPFSCYYDAEYKEEEADIELCLPVRGRISGGNGTELKELPAVRVLSVTHRGNYEMLNLAYKAVLDYAESHGFTCMVPSREIYFKGPGMIFKGNPAKYVTEIQVPITEEEKR